jgi:hypothetical protein
MRIAGLASPTGKGFKTCGIAEFMHSFEMLTKISGTRYGNNKMWPEWEVFPTTCVELRLGAQRAQSSEIFRNRAATRADASESFHP